MTNPESMQPCGHPVSAVVSSDEGTAYCGMCAQEPTCGIAGCVGKHYPQDHNAIFDTSTDDQSRSLFHSLQDVIRERDALRAELEHVRRERNTIHDWYVDAKTENVALRAEVEHVTVDRSILRYLLGKSVEWIDLAWTRYDDLAAKELLRDIREALAMMEDTNDE